jgi:hypothetical protein
MLDKKVGDSGGSTLVFGSSPNLSSFLPVVFSGNGKTLFAHTIRR